VSQWLVKLVVWLEMLLSLDKLIKEDIMAEKNVGIKVISAIDLPKNKKEKARREKKKK